MLISGLQKLTLLDYPGRVACTVFTGGCDFRCPFCHNSSLAATLGIKIFSRPPLFRVDRRMLEFKYKIVLCQDIGDMLLTTLYILQNTLLPCFWKTVFPAKVPVRLLSCGPSIRALSFMRPVMGFLFPAFGQDRPTTRRTDTYQPLFRCTSLTIHQSKAHMASIR